MTIKNVKKLSKHFADGEVLDQICYNLTTMLKIGIVGLPNAGKSTLFNALVTKPKAGVAAHPFTTIDKNIGVVEVPDETLFQLAKIENIGKVTPATITFVDIAGLIKGAHQG